MAYENAFFQWEEGQRRLRDAPGPDRASLERVTASIVEELRRRLGSSFSLAELAALYGAGTDWASDVAVNAGVATDAAAVVDAAFARYSREALDYSAGRRRAGRA